MAVAFSNLTSGGSETDATSYATASVTPGANRLVLLSVTSWRRDSTSPVAPSSVTGNGLTWVQVASVLYDAGGPVRARLSLFRAMGASPSAGAVTIDFGAATMSECSWTLDEASGVDTTGTDGSGAVVQTASNSASAATLTVTLAAFGSASNGAFGCFAHNANETGTPEAGWTELADQPTTGTTNGAAASQWRADNDTTCTRNGWATSSSTGGIAIEVKAGGGTTFMITPAGTTAPAGTLAKLAQKATSGSTTPAGTLARLAAKMLGGTAAPSGTVGKRAGKSLTGAASPSGAALRSTAKGVAGALSPDGALGRDTAKGLTGAATPLGALAKAVSKPLAGSTTPAGALELARVILLAIAGAISPGGALQREARKALAAATTPTGQAGRATSKQLFGTATPSGTLAKTITKGLTGTLALAGSLASSAVGAAVALLLHLRTWDHRAVTSRTVDHRALNSRSHDHPADAADPADH